MKSPLRRYLSAVSHTIRAVVDAAARDASFAMTVLLPRARDYCYYNEK